MSDSLLPHGCARTICCLVMSDSLLPHGPPVYCCCWVTKSCPTLCNPLNCSMPGFPTLHYLLEFAQIHVLWVCDGIQTCHPLSLSSFVFSLSQHQGLFKWVSSSHHVCILCLILNQDMSSFWPLLLGTTNEDRKELNFPFPLIFEYPQRMCWMTQIVRQQ